MYNRDSRRDQILGLIGSAVDTNLSEFLLVLGARPLDRKGRIQATVPTLSIPTTAREKYETDVKWESTTRDTSPDESHEIHARDSRY